RDLERFSHPGDVSLPPLLVGRVESATVPALSEAARYCGFVDFLPLSDGVVRSVPLWIQYDNRLIPQMGLALACAYMGADPRSLRIEADRVVIPGNGQPEVVIPVHAV